MLRLANIASVIMARYCTLIPRILSKTNTHLISALGKVGVVMGSVVTLRMARLTVPARNNFLLSAPTTNRLFLGKCLAQPSF